MHDMWHSFNQHRSFWGVAKRWKHHRVETILIDLTFRYIHPTSFRVYSRWVLALHKRSFNGRIALACPELAEWLGCTERFMAYFCRFQSLRSSSLVMKHSHNNRARMPVPPEGYFTLLIIQHAEIILLILPLIMSRPTCSQMTQNLLLYTCLILYSITMFSSTKL